MIPKHNNFKCKNIECGIIFPRLNKDSCMNNSKNIRKSNTVTCSKKCSKIYKHQSKHKKVESQTMEITQSRRRE